LLRKNEEEKRMAEKQTKNKERMAEKQNVEK
jgi:hypothetical protein